MNNRVAQRPVLPSSGTTAKPRDAIEPRERRWARRIAWLYRRSSAPMVGLGAILGFWYLVILVFRVSPILLPAPHAVLMETVASWRMLAAHGWTTSIETAGGLVIAVVIGVVLAAIMAEIPVVSRALLPWLVVSQAVPKVAVAPLFVIWFGFGFAPKIVVAFFIAFFPIVVSTISGLASVTPEEDDLFRTITPRIWPRYLHLKIPRALPYFFDGTKVGVTLALVGAVVGEFVSAQEGLGYLVILANRDLNTELVFAAFAALSIIGMAFFYAVVGIERLAVPWHFSRTKTANSGGR